MTEKQVAPYGSWKSPITVDMLLARSIGLGQIALDGDDTYWVEVRPHEGGRYAIVRRSAGGQTAEVTSPTFNARTLVHEYGGGAFAVDGGTLYFANYADQRLYRQNPAGAAEPITPETAMRYADLEVDRPRNRIICVREDHTGDGEAVNTLVSLDLAGAAPGQVLVEGNDFYASPRLSPDGRQLVWLTWNHPNMPWDGTELWLADVAADGSLQEPVRIAGGRRESIFQPLWSPDGRLYFVSDRTGWWNLYRWQNGETEPLLPLEAEFGVPQWIFGLSTYTFASENLVLCAYCQKGSWHLARLDLSANQLTPIEQPYTHLSHLHADASRLVLKAAGSGYAEAVVEFNLATGNFRELRQSNPMAVHEETVSLPEAIEYPTEGGRHAHGFFYRPRNREFQGPAGERPPLLVMSHGGPTSATSGTLKWPIQFWTSRGFAVLDVNYGGSTGYGRDYRERLRGRWGEVDVEDCVNGALYLARRGLVDRGRLAIRGGSAGGYTTLRALTTRDLFSAGASYFGLSDLEIFVKETHKFESRYLDSLIGPFPQNAGLYRQRSPIHYVDDVSSAMILFQGLEDRIVPPNQAELMVEALRKKGLPVAYLAFEGEQHGFRRAENIKRTIEAELYFYGRIFGFPIDDSVEPVEIENFPVPEVPGT